MENFSESDGIADPPKASRTGGDEAGDTADNGNGELVKHSLRKASKVKDAPIGNMASWAGTPVIKGSTESVRMMLLTFSLIGLQYVPFFYTIKS